MLIITAFLCWATLLWLLMDENDHSCCDDWDTARCLNSLACSFPHLVWFCWAFWNRLRSKGTKLPAFTRRFCVFLDLLFFKSPLFSAFKFRLGNRSWDAVYNKIMHTSGFFHIRSHKSTCSPNHHSMAENDKVKTTPFGESPGSSFSEWFTGSLIKTFECLSTSRRNVLWLFCAGWISSSPVWRRWGGFPCAPARVCCREKASSNWLSNTASTPQHTGSTPWWEGHPLLISSSRGDGRRGDQSQSHFGLWLRWCAMEL